MTELDALAPSRLNAWTHENVAVRRVPGAEFDAVRTGSTVHVDHGFTSADIGERLVPIVTAQARHTGLSQREFELVIVGIVRTTVSDPVDGWVTYYRNSMDELLSGAAEFAPIHQRAESLTVGSVLDLGSCFGFFPLRLAMKGRSVTATDLSAGTMRLLATVAPHLGITLHTTVCDAAHVPAADNSVDTVTALHLLEHVDSDTCSHIVTEALRIARSRVIIAVPFENETTACHGHIRTFDEATLIDLGRSTGSRFETMEHHGGWLVFDKPPVPQLTSSLLTN